MGWQGSLVLVRQWWVWTSVACEFGGCFAGVGVVDELCSSGGGDDDSGGGGGVVVVVLVVVDLSGWDVGRSIDAGDGVVGAEWFVEAGKNEKATLFLVCWTATERKEYGAVHTD